MRVRAAASGSTVLQPYAFHHAVSTGRGSVGCYDDNRLVTDEPQWPERDPQLLYELAGQRLATQLEFIDAADAKLGLLISTSSALVGVAAAVLALRSAQHFSNAGLAMVSLSGLAYVVLSIVTLHGYFVRQDWKVGPNLRQVWDLHFTEPDDSALKWNVARRLWEDADDNLSGHNTKLRAVRVGLRCLVVQTVALVVLLCLIAAR